MPPDGRHLRSDPLKLVILELELVAHIDAEGQQGDGDLGDDAGVEVLDIGIVAADINDGADHDKSPFSDEIGKDLLLRMRILDDVEPVLNIRTCDATVGDFVSGVRVPVDALYNYKDPYSGKEAMGVVVLDGGIQTFVETIIISYPDENTAFIRPAMNGSPLEPGKTVMLF